MAQPSEITLQPRELVTIQAALNLWLASMDEHCAEFFDEARDGEAMEQLTIDEIESLQERLNTAGGR